MQKNTIYDIAKKANVSASTVSRVINNKPNVKKTTKAHVLKILAECHYVPDETARGLVMQSSKMIGLLIADIRTTHHTDAIYYIERELAKNGYCCLILNTGTDEKEQTQYIKMLSQRKVDAAILIGSIYQTAAIKKAVQIYLSTTPTIILNGYLDAPNIYGLIADEENGVRNCVRLLVEKNRRYLAFIVDRYTPSNLLKLKGFESALAQYLGGARPVIVKTDESRRSAYEATLTLMKEHPEVDGIIYAEDILAVVGIRALTDMKIAIPERVAVVGINNSLHAENSIPTLTSLDNMLYDLSLTAVRNLMDVLRGQYVNKKMMICSEIVEREST